MITVVLRTTGFKIKMKKLSVFAGALLLGCSTWSFAASDVTLTVSGKINEGTCTLNLTGGNVTLDEIDSSNTSLNSNTPTKAKEVTLEVSDCSPGTAAHKPALKFSGNIVNQMWRDAKTAAADNDAGEAYGILINDKSTTALVCDTTNGKSILAGHCDLGAAGELLTGTRTIKLDVGYGKSGSTGINTGGIKSSINIAFVYH